jgi:hypothetical protein
MRSSQIRPDTAWSASRGQLYPIGPRRFLGGIKTVAVIVVGEEGHRCTVLTSEGKSDLHRRLRQGASNLVVAANKTGEVPFTTLMVLDEISRQLPKSVRVGRPRPVELKDVHGSGRILFDQLVGGVALDDDFEVRRRAPSDPGRAMVPTYAV